MKTIPEIRERLLEIAVEVEHLATRRRHPLVSIADEIKELAQATRSRTPVYRTERRRRIKKPEREAEHKRIREFALQHPGMSYLDMSAELATPTSNIANALRGRRDEHGAE